MKKSPILVAVTALALLTACSSDPPPAVQLGYDLPPRINLDVLTVTVQDRTAPPAPGSPNFKPTLVSTIQQYVNERIVAVGTTGQAVVTISDAGIVEQKLSYKDDAFTRAQASKYVGRAAVELSVVGRDGHGNVSASSSRFETLPQDATPIERQNAYNTVMNGIMHDVGRNLTSAVQTHLSNFVITAPILGRDNTGSTPVTPIITPVTQPLAAPYTYTGH